jgi:hypothetical protein
MKIMSSVSQSVLFGAHLSFTDFGFYMCHVHSNAEYFDKHGCVRQNRFANQLVVALTFMP